MWFIHLPGSAAEQIELAPPWNNCLPAHEQGLAASGSCLGLLPYGLPADLLGC